MRRSALFTLPALVLLFTGCGDEPTPTDLGAVVATAKPDKPGKPGDDGGDPSGPTVAPTIVFSETARRDGPTLFFMDVDGTRGEALAGGEPILGMAPRWSPDGTRFVFTREYTFKKAPSELRLMVASLDPGTDSWSVAQVPTSTTRVGIESDWSPDGWLLFHDLDDVGNLRTVRPDGTGETQLTFDGDTPDHALWSRDGSSILAHVHDGTGWSLRLYPVDCSGDACAQAGVPTEILPTDLGLDPLDDVAPLDWAHDSDRVLCAIATDAGWDLGILDLSGPDAPILTNWTDSPDAGESGGAWSSDDSRIVHRRWTFDGAPEQLRIGDVSSGAVGASVDLDGSFWGADWNPVPTGGG